MKLAARRKIAVISVAMVFPPIWQYVVAAPAPIPATRQRARPTP